MKKLESLALDEIKKNASSITMNLFESKNRLVEIKNSLMHCDPNLSKDALTDFINAAQKAIAGIDKASSSSTLIESWAEGLAEK